MDMGTGAILPRFPAESWLLLLLFLARSAYLVESSIERHYYVAAVEAEWDYTPSGHSLVEVEDEEFYERTKRRVDRIGSRYLKAVYRGFYDPNFQNPIPRQPSDGLLGPTLRGEAGDVVNVHFRNMATGSNFSMHPHGFQYRKNSEGALYIDGTRGSDSLDDGVPPGREITYTWYVTGSLEPTPDDDACVAWGYHSHNMAVNDIDTGLVGFLLTCRPGMLRDDGSRVDVDRELLLWSDIGNEANSHYIEENIRRCGQPGLCKKLHEDKDEKFIFSNRFYHINGYVYGNLPDFSALEGTKVVWYFMSLNSGVHTIHINGQTMVSQRRRVDTVVMISAIFLSGYMIPVNPGRWLVDCRNQYHYKGGMQAFFHVRPSPFGNPGLDMPPGGRVKKYFIAAEEVLWDYSPNVQIDTFAKQTFLGAGQDRIGSKYKKAIYRRYTDDTFKTRVPRAQSEKHWGIAGPVMRVEVGDVLQVVFLNRASRPYSVLANGVMMTKDNEGAFYKQTTFDKLPSGVVADPGEVRLYTFNVPNNAAPTELDPECIVSTYHSAVDLSRDIYSGLFGPILICKQGTLDKTTTSRSIDREFFINWMVFDENHSWYIDDNIEMFLPNPMAIDKENEAFKLSNKKRALNGRTFGSLEGLYMCLNDRVAWYMYGLGERFDHHHFGFDGNNFYHDGRNIDTSSVFPGIGKSVVMVPDQVGVLNLRNQQLGYEYEGMFADYTVMQCNEQKQSFPFMFPRIPVNPIGIVRRYFIAAVEGEWDYCPVKVDPIKGQSLLEPNSHGYRYVRSGPKFIGSVYAKVLYRQFTDATFSTMKPVTERTTHLGMLGPFIKGNVGDTIEIVFKNKASFPYSLVPRNLVFQDGSPISQALPAPPGKTVVYNYVVPKRSSPGPKEPNCVASLYSSRVHPLNDTYAGLFGPLVICREGILDEFGKRTDQIDREFAVSFAIVDENKSHYSDFNVNTKAPGCVNKSEKEFVESNKYFSMNGYIYGNLPGLVMEEGESVAWYVFAIGSQVGIHSAHYHGQIYLRRTKLALVRDVLEIYPGVYETVEMKSYNPGTWLFHCHVGIHSRNGMKAVYTILPRGVKVGPTNLAPPLVDVAVQQARQHSQRVH